MKVEEVMKTIARFPMNVFMRVPGMKRYAYQYLMQQTMAYEACGDHYCSLYCRPKHASQLVSVERETPARCQTAIVMQGPLIANDDFTVETVKVYGKLYPGVTVIVSTWADEDQQVLERLRKLNGCKVVLSNKPAYSGVLNLNYQVVSTMAGIRCAKELGLQYVAKTRCDFRFVKFGLIEYLIGLCDAFPVESSVRYQKQRIIVMGDYLGSFFRAFWVADRFSFGCVDDMLSFWNYDLDELDWPKQVVYELLDKEPKTWREVTEAGLCAEPRIILNYLQRMEGKQPECSVKRFWDVLKRQFITISYNELGAYWVKPYQGINEAQVRGEYCGEMDHPYKCLCYNWDFARWLALYQGRLPYEESYEDFQRTNIGF